MSWLRSAVTVAVGAAVALAAVGCAAVGGEDPKLACVVVDASKSTRFVVPRYEEDLTAEVEALAEEGGSIVTVVVTGDPTVEAIPRLQDFSGLTGTEREGDRDRAVRQFVADVRSEVRASAVGQENPSGGSGIVAGIDLLAGGNECGSMLALSDGLETDAFASKTAGVGNPAIRARILQRLEAEGLVPELDGIPLLLPFGGVLPQGTAIPRETLDGLRSFWAEYAEAAGTSLSWRSAA